MQRYKNKSEEQPIIKQILLEFVDFIRAKIENDTFTIGEMQSIVKAVMEQMEIYGTIDELSAFYGKSKDAVNGIIKRNMVQKPRLNVVLYSLTAFSKIIPANWRKKH